MRMFRKNWKDRKGVSPVIATILMVAITVVLAAVLYVMVMGFGGEDSQTPNVALASRATSTPGNYEVYVVSVSGGSIAFDQVEAVVVSGDATFVSIEQVGTSTPKPDNLMAGDKATIKTSGTVAGETSSVTVMFRDKVSGASLGQTTLTVTVPTPVPPNS